MAKDRNKDQSTPPDHKQRFQGGGRTGTPFTPDQDRPGEKNRQQGSTPTKSDDYSQPTGKEGERRSGQSPGGRTGPGADTEPL